MNDTQTVTIFGQNLPNGANPNGGAFVIHRKGCRDALILEKNYRVDPPWDMEAASKTEIAVDGIYADHIAEGSMDADDALSDCHFCPCVTIPEVTARRGRVI